MEAFVTAIKRWLRRRLPVVTIDIDVFAPDGRRSLTIHGAWPSSQHGDEH